MTNGFVNNASHELFKEAKAITEKFKSTIPARHIRATKTPEAISYYRLY